MTYSFVLAPIGWILHYNLYFPQHFRTDYHYFDEQSKMFVVSAFLRTFVTENKKHRFTIKNHGTSSCPIPILP